MIFGGLEIVAGGYLIHRHYKKKNEIEKQRIEVEAQQRRNNTFPGANNAKPNGWNTQAHHRPTHHQHQGTIPAPHKYTYNAPPLVPTTPLPQYQHHQPQYQSPPQSPSFDVCPSRPTHTQSFNIPRRPVPDRKAPPEIIIPAGLQRSDSMATLSRMPIANGSRPHDIVEEPSPSSAISPARRHATGGLQAPTQPSHGVYGNAGFSMSTPAFGATQTSPPVAYEMATGTEGRYAVDDNWETYGVQSAPGSAGAPGYAPTVSTELGERDPPPPYMP